MFLNSLVARNPALIHAAVDLHQQGRIPANSYVLDLDAIGANARIFSDEAARLGLKVFAMTKQIGRNGPALDAMGRGGIGSFVAVDMAGARAVAAAGHHVGHVGHLVQVPQPEADAAAALEPDYWTVFSLTKAREAAGSAQRIGRMQDVLLRVHGDGDTFYMGHEGGFPLSGLREAAEEIGRMDGARVAGVVTFPALLYSRDTGDVYLTPNVETLRKAREVLADLGVSEVEVNAPGTTSTAVLELLAGAGATQVEPGHGLTATTPLHVVRDLPETPAIVYLSEVAHHHGGRAYCFGGGLYIDPVFEEYQVTALVGRSGEQALQTRLNATLLPPAAIDYYGLLDPGDRPMPEVGASVVFGFRAQAFVTQAYVVPLVGVGSGDPEPQGIWHSNGLPASWPGPGSTRGSGPQCAQGTQGTQKGARG